ncbi:MAG: transcriptional regulator PpsR [Halieaceae bacterium]|nr:transcriptional regulator PpsR [Halieaceae bacterium]
MLADQPKPVLATLLSGVADFLVGLDSNGRVKSVDLWSDELPTGLAEALQGRRLTETLASADEARVEEVLSAAASGAPQRLDVVHLLADGALELPVQYRVCADPSGRIVAAGMDLRPTASLRQQLVNAQQALEQDYWRLRNVETRYRRLFDMVADGVLVLDALSSRVLEINPRGNELLDGGDKGVVGKVFPRGFDDESSRELQDLLSEIRSVGRGQRQSLRLADGETRVDVSASFLRQGGEERFLLRVGTRGGFDDGASGSFMPEVLRNAPDAVLLTDEDGRIAAANQAFLELAQLVAEEQAIGHSADRWLGRSGVDLSVLLANVREKDSVKLFSSTLMPHAGSPAQVEISACRLHEPDGAAFALFIRDIERRIASEHPVTSKLPSSIEQVTKRVGRVPLKELVRESTDLIEALCIETALEVTQDNRASAAELLGLSRQSLYAKLRRFNIGALDDSEAAD